MTRQEFNRRISIIISVILLAVAVLSFGLFFISKRYELGKRGIETTGIVKKVARDGSAGMNDSGYRLFEFKTPNGITFQGEELEDLLISPEKTFPPIPPYKVKILYLENYPDISDSLPSHYSTRENYFNNHVINSTVSAILLLLLAMFLLRGVIKVEKARYRASLEMDNFDEAEESVE